MRLPKSVRERFRAYGREGGRARAARMSPGARESVARKAAIGRWIRVRFGAPSFEALGLPGGEVIDAGLAALAAGEESTESLLVSLAAPRLRREGVPVPHDVFPDADAAPVPFARTNRCRNGSCPVSGLPASGGVVRGRMCRRPPELGKNASRKLLESAWSYS